VATERLPRSIAFPRGIKVPVRLVTDEMMVAVAGVLNDGLWHDGNHTIYIRQKLSPAERAETFYHEMHHCVADLEWGERCLVAKKEVPPPVERQLGLPLEGK
jgi:hypothetical protein